MVADENGIIDGGLCEAIFFTAIDILADDGCNDGSKRGQRMSQEHVTRGYGWQWVSSEVFQGDEVWLILLLTSSCCHS